MPPPNQNAFSRLTESMGHSRMVEDRSRELGMRRRASLETDMLNTQREQARKSEELGNIQDRNSRQYLRGLQEMEDRQEHLNQLQEQHTHAVRQSQTVMQRGFHDAAASAGESIRNSIGGAINDAAAAVVSASKRAQQAVIQTSRGLPDVSDYATAMGGYTAMLDDALMTSLRYGQGMEEITAVQHQFISDMNIDVAAGGFSDRVARMTDTMAYLAVRTGQTVEAVQSFASAALETFGRGGQAQIEAFRRTMLVMSQIPAVLRADMIGLHEDVGNLFSNPETQMMIQTWTEQFADQATNISEMAAAMLLFQRNAAKAGHSTRTLNVLTNGLVQGIQGQRGANANTVRAGQILQRRIHEDPNFIQNVSDSMQRRTGTALSRDDRALIERLGNGDSGLNASDLFHMLKGTAAGMDAFMEGMVGMTTGNVSITKSMLEAQGIDTGTDANNLRLAQLIEDQGQGKVIDQDEVSRLLTRAADRETAESEGRSNQFRNIGLTAEATQRTAVMMGQLMGWLTNDLKGVMILAIIAAATGAATHETEGEEQARLTREWERGLPTDLAWEVQQLPTQDRNQFSGMDPVELRAALEAYKRRQSNPGGFVLQGAEPTEQDLVSLDAQRTQLEERFNTTTTPAPVTTPTTPSSGARNVIDTVETPPPAPTTPAWAERLNTPIQTPGTTGANAPGSPGNPVTANSPASIVLSPNGNARMNLLLGLDIANFTSTTGEAIVQLNRSLPPGTRP